MDLLRISGARRLLCSECIWTVESYGSRFPLDGLDCLRSRDQSVTVRLKKWEIEEVGANG